MIIGLHGSVGAGKSTIANGLYDKDVVTVLSFAGPMKRAMMELFGFSHEQVYDPKLKEQVTDWEWDGKKVSPRYILQMMGTEVLRTHAGEGFFLKRMQHAIEQVPKGNVIFIDDVRFDNEADFITSMGGIVIHIVRPSDAPRTVHHTHTSEKPLSSGKATHTVINDETVELLLEKVENIILNSS